MIFKNCTVITCDQENNIYQNGALVIKDGRIVAAGKEEKLEKKYSSEKKINLKGNIVIPGLINTHTHIPMVLFRGIADDLPLKKWLEDYIWPLEKEMIDENFTKWGALLGMMEMISTGTTTFSDMYFYEDIIAGEVKKAGMRGVLGQGVIDFPTPDAKDPQENINIFKNLAEKWKDDENINISMCAHSPYTCSKDLLKETKKIAEDYDTIFHIHVAETRNEKDMIEDKNKTVSPVKYLDNLNILDENVLAAHSVWLDGDDIDIFKKRDVKVSHNITSHLKLGSGIAPVDKYLKKDITVSLGTDGAASNNKLNMFSEMRIASLVHKGYNLKPTLLNSEEVLKMGTINGARALNLDKEIGSIEKGKRADFVVIEKDRINFTPFYNPISNIIYSSTGDEVKSVYIDGKLVYEDKEFKTIDGERVKYEVEKISKKIRSKV